jgi:hypothetical protein
MSKPDTVRVKSICLSMSHGLLTKRTPPPLSRHRLPTSSKTYWCLLKPTQILLLVDTSKGNRRIITQFNIVQYEIKKMYSPQDIV